MKLYSLLEAIADGEDLNTAIDIRAKQESERRKIRETILAAHYMRQGKRPQAALEQAARDLEVTE